MRRYGPIVGYEAECPGCHRWFDERDMRVIYGVIRYCADCFEPNTIWCTRDCPKCGEEFRASPKAPNTTICLNCRLYDGRTERARVERQLRRAEACGAPATLTLGQWIETLRDFGGKCAYCQEADFEVLEHFEDVSKWGTTIGNCVPACSRCNARKQRNRAWGILPKDLERVHGYLSRRRRILMRRRDGLN